jgi:hypothetical protein
VSYSHDYTDEMLDDFSEDDVEALLVRGRVTSGRRELTDVSRIIGNVRAASLCPVPAPSSALRAMMLGARPSSEPYAPAVVAPSPFMSRLSSRLAIATAIASIGLTGAAAADLLPGPVGRAVVTVVEGATPFQLPDASARPQRQLVGDQTPTRPTPADPPPSTVGPPLLLPISPPVSNSADIFRRMPAAELAKLPIEVLRTLPPGTLDRLPTESLSRLPTETLRSLSTETLNRLPAEIRCALPIDLLSRLTADGCRLPTQAPGLLPAIVR